MSLHITDSDILVGALTIYGEARGDSQLGRVAVAHSILNRCRAESWWGRNVGNYPDHSIAAVCLKPWQYSVWNPNDPNMSKLAQLKANYRGAIQNRHCRAALKALIDAVDGYEKDPTNGACHYVTKYLYESGRAPDWARGIPYTEIGKHYFFKGVK